MWLWIIELFLRAQGVGAQDIAKLEKGMPALGKLLKIGQRGLPVFEKFLPIWEEIKPLLQEAEPIIKDATAELKTVMPAAIIVSDLIRAHVESGASHADAQRKVVSLLRQNYPPGWYDRQNA